MGFLSDLLGGQNKWQIDNAYKKQVDDLGAEKSRSFFSDLEQSDLYNKNKDYFNSIGLTENPYNAETRMANSNAYAKALGDLEDERAREWKKNKFNIAGNGLVGAFANPLIQVGDIAGDMFASPFRAIAGEETNRYRRDPEKDFLSDVGAIGDTALNVATLGAGAGALKGGASLGKAMKTQALIGAGGSAMNTLRENGGYTDFGNLLANTAIGGAVGGAIGGGLYGLGKASKLWNTSPDTALVKYTGAGAGSSPAYQEALRTLGLSGDDLSEATLNTAKKQATKNIAKTVGYETAEGQAQRTAVNNAYQTLLKGANPSTEALANVAPAKLSLSQKLSNLRGNLAKNATNGKLGRAGTKVSGLLKTKAGKVGAGIGGGLLLANLLRGSGGTPASEPELTDEELYYLLTEGGY